MADNELFELNLEDIINEFRDYSEPEEIPEAEEPAVLEAETPAAPEAAPRATESTIRLEGLPKMKGEVRSAEPIVEEEPAPVEVTPEQPEAPVFQSNWEPEYEQPIGEYVPPRPISINPRSRFQLLKKKLIEGPEKRYYDLSKLGVGKLQAAIFLNLLVVLLSAGSTAMYALGMVQPDRLRLMVFGQFLAMLISALLGSFQIIEGVESMLSKRFTLNSLLAFAFLFCCIDGVLCLQQVRVPCCAAFSLAVTASLWSTYHARVTELGQTDTLRKASRLYSLYGCPDYYKGRAGILRSEGEPESFMDHYTIPSKPENVLSWYAILATLAAMGIGITAGVLRDVSTGFQVAAVSMLAAMPVTIFISLSRPMSILEQRLHHLGVVLCGWQGVEQLTGNAVFPVEQKDLFPNGSIKLNGVKFFGKRDTDQVVAYATAVISADGGGLTPVFQQLLDSRNTIHYDTEEFKAYPGGGIGGIVEGETVLVGTYSFMKQMNIEIPENTRVKDGVYVAIDGALCGLFAIVYERVKAVNAAFSTLCGYRKLNPMLVSGDFMLTDSFLRSHFGIKPRRLLRPDPENRPEQPEAEPNPSQAAALCTYADFDSYAFAATGARSLRTACKLGITIHLLGGILGLAIMLLLTLINATNLLTPANMFLYQLVWIIPGLLITEWTRVI